MSAFIGNLDVRLVQDTAGGQWSLLAPFSFQSDLAGVTITVPSGFDTDFCSVPRVPLIYDMLGDRARRSGTVHDWLYTCQTYTRELSDQILKEMLLVDGIDHIEADAFYLAVRQCGGAHWLTK
jgi:hypothetical protein